jgi:hypothetical protein
LDSPFSEEELEIAIGKSRVGSLPGIDGIDYAIIKEFPKGIRRILLVLFNEIYLSETFPNEWKEYMVFCIPKEDKKKVRPISLAPCLLKVLERMIKMRLYGWLEYNLKLPKSQFGFRRDNLAILCSDSQGAFDEKEVTEVVTVAFLDIQSAYDNVLADILMNKLLKIGLRGI